MWFAYVKTLGLTAVQGLLSVDSVPHPEKPEPAANKPSVVATANLDVPITAYELHYGIVRRSSNAANPTS
ncbi:MAG: hypothetical protein JNM43_29560 [Planctomycetaceae bacterium]|nr:hypothetical protein [Planctomycetaceae bacterium]